MELWLPEVRHSCHYHPNHYRFWPHHSHSIHRNYRYQHIFPVLNGTHGKSTIKTEQQVTPIWQKLPRPPVKDVNADFFTVCAVLATHKINGLKCEKKKYFVCVCDGFVRIYLCDSVFLGIAVGLDLHAAFLPPYYDININKQSQ